MKSTSKSVPKTFTEIMIVANTIPERSAKTSDSLLFLFNSLRKLSDLSSTQIEQFLNLNERKLEDDWIIYLTKMTVSLSNTPQTRDVKIVAAIQDRCNRIFDEYKIRKSDLTKAEEDIRAQDGDGRSITEFLLKIQSEKNQNTANQISDITLARLTYIYFTLYRISTNANAKIQLMIDRAIAEHFSAPELSGISEKDIAGKKIGIILANKTNCLKNISLLTYLYTGTSERIANQVAQIRELKETRKEQQIRINNLTEALDAEQANNQKLQEEIVELKAQIQTIQSERDAAENMLIYERNKYEKQLSSQGSDLAKKLSYTIGFELEPLRELATHLEPINQKRILRRLDCIEQYLNEFRGEE